MICDNNFIMQTCVALMSLYANKERETAYAITVIMADCEQISVQSIQQMNKDNFSIYVIETSVSQYGNIKQLAHVPLASLLKFDICNIVSQYDKFLYLDGDIIVRQDLSSLFCVDLKDNYVAGVAHSSGILTGLKKVNGGVLLFNARKIREEKLRNVFIRTRQSMGDRKSMDQETFHEVFGDKKIFLPPKYNVMIDKVDYEKKFYSIKEYNQFFNTSFSNRKDIISSAVIIHFTGSIKPWNYRFAKGAMEWYNYYLLTYPNEKKISRKGRLAYLNQCMRDSGIKSVYWIIKDYVLEFIGDKFGIFLDKSYEQWN